MSSGNKSADRFIPMAKPWIDESTINEVGAVLRSGWIVQGSQVSAFEEAIAGHHRISEAVAVSSATAGLHLAYLAFDPLPGAPCFIPSFAWPSAANMAVQTGLRPVFVEVDPSTYNLTGSSLQAAIQSEKLSGQDLTGGIVVAVHEFGLCAPMPEVIAVAEKHGLMVIEDAACAFGATLNGSPAGHFGKMAVFSFHPRKSMTTGEGGCIVTNDKSLATAVRALRNHGQHVDNGERTFISAGFNYRMTDFQAALGLGQMLLFDEMLAHRRSIAAAYFEALEGLSFLSLPEWSDEHTWQTFMVVLNESIDRGRVIDAMATRGIGCGPGSVAAHELQFFSKKYPSNPESLTISSRLAAQGLALPMHHFVTVADIKRIAQALEDSAAEVG